MSRDREDELLTTLVGYVREVRDIRRLARHQASMAKAYASDLSQYRRLDEPSPAAPDPGDMPIGGAKGGPSLDHRWQKTMEREDRRIEKLIKQLERAADTLRNEQVIAQEGRERTWTHEQRQRAALVRAEAAADA